MKKYLFDGICFGLVIVATLFAHEQYKKRSITPGRLVAVQPGAPRLCKHCGKEFPNNQFAEIFGRRQDGEGGLSVAFGKAAMSIRCWDACTEEQRFEGCVHRVIKGWLRTKEDWTPDKIDLVANQEFEWLNECRRAVTYPTYKDYAESFHSNDETQ